MNMTRLTYSAFRPLVGFAAVVAVFAASSAAWADSAFVQTTGDNYIVTDYYPNPNTRIEVDFQLDETANVSQPRIFATRTADANYLSCVLYVNGKKNWAYSMKDGDVSGIVIGAADTDRHTFVLDGPAGTAKFDNTDLTFSQTRTKTASQPLHLFVQTPWVNGTLAKAKLYSLKIYEKTGDEYALVRDYAPCVQDGIPGIKCGVTGAFHSAFVSSQLSSGGDIESIASGDAYLQSTGSASINTGYLPTQNTAIEVDYSIVEKGDVSQPRIFGSRGLDYRHYINGSGKFAFAAYDTSNTPASGTVGYNTNTGLAMDTGVRHTFRVDKPAEAAWFKTGNITNYSTTAIATELVAEQATGSLLIFSGADWSSQYSKIKLYSLNIYEDGTLVRSYIPYVKNGCLGLYDTTGGNFHAYQDGTYGGAIGHDNCDAYLESDGTQAIVSDYYPNPDTRIEVDFKLNDTANVAQPRIFATHTKSADNLSCALYVNSKKNFAFSINDGDISGVVMTAADTVRHTFILDSPAGEAHLVTGTTTNSYDITATRTTAAALPLWIFAQSTWLVDTKAMANLYSLRVYEKNNGEYVLVREYLPWMSNGVGGLYETQSDTVFTNSLDEADAFAVAGMGTDGSGSGALLVTPQDTRVKGSRPSILTAYAPGAVAYRWTQGGEVLDGETAATLSVSRIEGAREIVYGVTPIFDVFGTTVEGETATCTVDHGVLPFLLLVR